MIRLVVGILVYAALFVISFMVGGLMAMYFFVGTLTLLGLVIIVESVGFFRWLFTRFFKTIDIIFFGINFVMMFLLGVTVAMSFIVANVGFSLVYRPYLANRLAELKAYMSNGKTV